MKFIYFFLCLWVIFALLDPDPDYESESGYESRDPIESGSAFTKLLFEQHIEISWKKVRKTWAWNWYRSGSAWSTSACLVCRSGYERAYWYVLPPQAYSRPSKALSLPYKHSNGLYKHSYSIIRSFLTALWALSRLLQALSQHYRHSYGAISTLTTFTCTLRTFTIQALSWPGLALQWPVQVLTPPLKQFHSLEKH